MTSRKADRHISIHALLAESDHDTYVIMEATKVISIHALLAESDCPRSLTLSSVRQFLSTLSLRRATPTCTLLAAPCAISIHALLAESDGGFHKINCQLMVFLSTLSLRRATRYPDAGRFQGPDFYPRSPCGERLLCVAVPQHVVVISIHALLAESDYLATW